MHDERGKIGHLIESGIVANTLLAIELHLAYVAAGIIRTHITHVAETTRHIDIGIEMLMIGSCLGDEIERNGIKEVGTIGSLEQAQLHTFGLTGT